MGPHAVPARKEEAEALSSGAWQRHRGGSAAMIAIDRRSRTTRRLGAMQLASGPQARRQAKVCDGQLTEAWMEHLGTGRGRNFTGGQRGEEQRKGTGLGGYRAP
jgi:hypothetical protein